MNKRNRFYNPALEYSLKEEAIEPEVEMDYEQELEIVEEPTIEVPQNEEPIEEAPAEESQLESTSDISELDAAMKLIAGVLGTEESEIREALAKIGHDYEKITDVKDQILAGTYF